MTLDDLVDVFNSKANLPSIRKADIAGIRAVVVALRNHFSFVTYPHDDWDCISIEGVFDEILASDGEEKAAGGSTSNGEQISVGVVVSPVPDDLSTPAADTNASAVCEWARLSDGRYRVECREYVGPVSEKWPRKAFCPMCKARISIKSEAAR
jgi:hypothetical protein